MAKLPDVTSFGRRPIPQGAPAVAPLDTSAEHRALADYWGTVTQTGLNISEVYLRRQKEADTYKAEDAYNKLQQRSLELNAEYSQIKGEDAVKKPIYKEYGEKFDSYASELSTTLENEEQRKLFQSRKDVAKLRYNGDLLNHVTQERSQYEKQVYLGGVAVEHQNAASHYYNPAAVASSIFRTEKLTEAEADREGWAPDVKKGALAEAKSNIHEAVIRNALGENQTEYAKSWFKTNKKEILGTKHAELERLIEGETIRETSQKAVEEYFTQNLTEAQAKAEARKKFVGAEQDAVIQRIEVRYGEAEQERNRKYREAGDQAWAIFGETKRIDAIPVKILQEMDGKERVALESTAVKAAKGEDVETDLKTYYGLMEIADKQPEVFKKLNLYQSYNKISRPDLDRLIEMQRNSKSLDLERSKSEVRGEAALAVGLDPGDAKKDSNSGERVRKFYDRIDQESIQFQTQNGREPNSKELKEITDRLAIKVLRERSFWFDKETPVAQEEIEGVPAEMVDELANAIQNAGQPVTPENIQKLYKYIQ